MTVAEYVWAEGSRLKADPAVIGKALQRLFRNGQSTPQAIVQAAKPPHSPLHPIFEWSDVVAGGLYREEQARHLARSIRIIREPGGEPERLYAHVTTEKLDAYVTSARIAGDVELQEALLREAVSYLRGAQKRYGELSALKGVWQALDEIDSAD